MATCGVSIRAIAQVEELTAHPANSHPELSTASTGQLLAGYRRRCRVVWAVERRRSSWMVERVRVRSAVSARTRSVFCAVSSDWAPSGAGRVAQPWSCTKQITAIVGISPSNYRPLRSSGQSLLGTISIAGQPRSIRVP